MAAKTNLWLRAVQRELTSLSDASILIKEINGQQTYYRINQDFPIAADLCSIFAKVAVNGNQSDGITK